MVKPSPALFVCAQLEAELSALEPSESAELLDSYGVQESGLIKLIHAAYDALGLQSYLTAGHKEVRAWTIPRGATAPEAAGVIHGDFERGFIAADIVSYTDLLADGSLSAARSAGGGLTVVVEASNSTTTAVQWFGFAATYADDTGAVVECAGVWGTVDLVGGATVSFLLAFPEAALPGVISLTGLREDGVDVAATVDVPSPTG